jgi:hypothetical protein
VTVKEFVDAVQGLFSREPEIFERVCEQAKTGKMGFGPFSNAWGTADGKG